MDFLILIFSAAVLIGGLIAAILSNIVASEIYDWLPTIARRIVNHSINRLPDAAQHRYREEWHAHLNECPTKIAKLWHAVGCYFSVREVASNFVEDEYQAILRRLGFYELGPEAKEIFAALLPALKNHYATESTESEELLAKEIERVLSAHDEDVAESAVEAWERLIAYIQMHY